MYGQHCAQGDRASKWQRTDSNLGVSDANAQAFDNVAFPVSHARGLP